MDSHEALRRAIAAEHVLYLEAQKHEQQAERWRKRAELALSRAEDGLARQALERSAAEERLAADYRTQYLSQTEAVRRAKRVQAPIIPAPSAEDRLNKLEIEERLERDLAALKASLASG